MKTTVLMSVDKNDLKKDIQKMKKENKNVLVGDILKKGIVYKVTISYI
jgi:hypothetical protein